MQATNDVFANAFQLLASTVREFHGAGRPCLGATLKPRLYQQHFDERLLGFRKFGDFLRSAEVAGYVRLTSTSGGDIGVLPGSGLRNSDLPSPGGAVALATVAPAGLPSPTAPVRVRQDLWNAFNSHAANWVYDPTSDIAFKDSQASGGWGAAPSNPGIIPIPSGRERVTDWMRSFANMQDPELKAQLSGVLDGDAGLFQFNNLMRSKGLLRYWSRFHIQNVLAAIESWAAVNKIHPRNVTSPLYSSVPPGPSEFRAPDSLLKVGSPEGAVAAAPAAAPLNARLASLIDSLINDLISLRGLLEVTGQH